jgi:AGZA family xanthine/uracil permease-like MFS transporter
MAYIVFVNPQTLAAAGMDPGAVFVATCLAAAYGSLSMGLLANYPVATAPSMGLNAFFAFVVVKTMGLSFPAALAGVFVASLAARRNRLEKIRPNTSSPRPARSACR